MQTKGEGKIHAWAHMVNATGAELLAKPVCSGEAEIGDSNSESAVEAQHVLRFEVPMIYAQRMAIFDGIKKLKKYVFNKVILSEVAAVVQDLREEITVGSVVHDEVGVVVLFHDPVEGDYVWVGRRKAMKGDFPHV